MSELFLEREFEQPLRAAVVSAASEHLAEQGCVKLHRVEWLGSLLSADGHRMVCRFRAPDAESLRIVLRTVGVEDLRCLWSGTLHERPGLTGKENASANVLVRRRFAQPISVEDIQALEDAGAWCLEARQVKFIRTYCSTDCKRMICLYHAPDAESVRQAQRQANMPVEGVWSFVNVLP
jgi:hypothetical protein